MLRLVDTLRDEHATTCRCPRCESSSRWRINWLNLFVWGGLAAFTAAVWTMAYIGLQAVLS